MLCMKWLCIDASSTIWSRRQRRGDRHSRLQKSTLFHLHFLINNLVQSTVRGWYLSCLDCKDCFRLLSVRSDCLLGGIKIILSMNIVLHFCREDLLLLSTDAMFWASNLQISRPPQPSRTICNGTTPFGVQPKSILAAWVDLLMLYIRTIWRPLGRTNKQGPLLRHYPRKPNQHMHPVKFLRFTSN